MCWSHKAARNVSLLAGVVVAWLGVARAGNAPIPFHEKTFAQLSDRRVTEVGRQALDAAPDTWKHAETAHFVIHFQRSGPRVASRCEDFYAETREFFGNRADRTPDAKSHVFAFSDDTAWRTFKSAVRLSPLVAGVTIDTEFFWKATDDRGQFEDLAPVQRHEMTHLIFNRLFEGRPPLWLNEGIAEFFGHRRQWTSVAYRQRLRAAPDAPLTEVFAARRYPRSELAIHTFYVEASRLVFFLARNPARQALLPKFTEAMIAGQSIEEALQIYGYEDLDDFTRDYRKFCDTL